MVRVFLKLLGGDVTSFRTWRLTVYKAIKWGTVVKVESGYS